MEDLILQEFGGTLLGTSTRCVKLMFFRIVKSDFEGGSGTFC